MKNKNKAFTLTELLVVVIVLGVLAAVAAPKFTRVLETRRTTEAEDLLSAVRTEQEHRCLAGKNYTARPSLLPMTAKADSKYYGLSLEDKGAVAARGDNKNYELRILYNSGKLCCSGEGCAALNKDYEPCDANWGNLSDECAATDGGEPVPPPADPCVTNPNDCECSTYASAHQCECAPSTSTCCEEGETWNEQTQECDKVCLEKTEYIGSSSASETDTCDGNTSAKYTCDGVFNGTCIDVYEGSGFQAGLASWTVDPFWNFANTTTVAQNCMGMGGTPCGTVGGTVACCPSGYYCEQKGAVFTCVQGFSPVDPNLHACPMGEKWDDNLKKCVSSSITQCGAGCTWDPVVKACKCTATECEDGAVWSPSLQKCVKVESPSVEFYSKRSVTCCGTGGTVPVVPEEDSCLKNPNQQKCCADGEEWNGSACVDSCQANPNQEKCCTAEQEWNGSECAAKCEEILAGAPWINGGPSTDTCDGDSVNALSACPKGKTGKCYDVRAKSSAPEYAYLGAVENLPADTCDGNITSRYTCPAGVSKTCVDVLVSVLSGSRDNRTMSVKQDLSHSGGVDRTMPNCPASGSCADLNGAECYYEDGPYRAIKACYYQNVQTATLKCGDNPHEFREVYCCGK